ncbi:MAG: DUF6252 family protein [Bacteroidia bacterium]
MKTLAFFVLLLFAACEREAPQPTDPLDLLPPATQTGENTLGFLLDGEPWTPNRIFQGDYRKSDGRFGITARYVLFDENGDHAGSNFGIGSITVPIYGEGIYELTNYGNLSAVIVYFEDCSEYWSTSEIPGQLNILKLDTINRIISGTFYFRAVNKKCLDTLNITNGRFDVSF